MRRQRLENPRLAKQAANPSQERHSAERTDYSESEGDGARTRNHRIDSPVD